MSILSAVIVAFLLDFCWGELRRCHPLVGFGNFAQYLENALYQPQKYRGVLALVLACLPITYGFYYLEQWQYLQLLVSPFALYFCIGNTALNQHATAVYTALEAHDLALARRKLSLIVSRQTHNMDADEIRIATVESVLENGNDAVFAPLFWFVVAGAWACVLYRLINTLDAMWGYKNQRYAHFGWAAARLDDWLNIIPARLTACCYAVLGNTSAALASWKNEARQMASPNAGVVMATGAGALGLRLGGTACYDGKIVQKARFGGDNTPNNADIKRACQMVTRSVCLWIFAIAAVSLGQYLA